MSFTPESDFNHVIGVGFYVPRFHEISSSIKVRDNNFASMGVFITDRSGLALRNISAALAYGFGWCVIGLSNLVTSEPFPVLLAIALTPAIATGITWWLFLDWLPSHELKRNIASY